ncbi:MarR family transcriptional regulator [Sneathiella sp. P13V-1]|uniref:MarR family winged helix-turn-helix transcriptional regulator n=1 Tax=Sneathiella sp. P13V-1 TaxID=2697366 RepID=UPI00187BB455|nr:MarR family winged helix-turn-helix transcriptional regulator [Sneathiella sp. P13V-1]MBE7635398.1 MarR family transcriptional regulator [Sneathiella sp. P13V-1]
MQKYEDQLYEVIRLLRPTVRHIGTHVEIKSRNLGLSVGMRATLEILVESGPQSVPDIARHLFVERQYIQRSVNDLLAANLVTREQNPKHKSSYLIKPSEKGRRAFHELKSVEGDVLKNLQSLIPIEDVQTSYTTLKTLTEHFIDLNRTEGGSDE